MILGPVLFNIFFNDIFNFVEERFLYNYVDDNTLSYSDTELNKVVDILEKERLMPWVDQSLYSPHRKSPIVNYYMTSDNVFSDWLTSLVTFFDKTL